MWQAERELLISGPTIPRADSPARWDQPTGCLPDLLDSVERIIDLDLELLIPAHGETIKGKDKISSILEQHQKFLSSAIDSEGTVPKSWPRPSQTCNYLTPRPAWEI